MRSYKGNEFMASMIKKRQCLVHFAKFLQILRIILVHSLIFDGIMVYLKGINVPYENG